MQKQGEIDKSTFLVADFNTQLSIFDRTRREIISKDIESEKATINPFDIFNVDRRPTIQQ